MTELTFTEQMDENKGTPCEVCGAKNVDRPMVFRGERWCSDLHRKMVVGELPLEK
jgi:hypothetical protein